MEILLLLLTVIFTILAVAYSIYAYITIRYVFTTGGKLESYYWIVPAILWGLLILFQNLLWMQ